MRTPEQEAELNRLLSNEYNSGYIEFVRSQHNTAKSQLSFINTMLVAIFIQLCVISYKLLP